MNRKHFDAAWVAALVLFIIGAVLSAFVRDTEPWVISTILFAGLAALTLA